MTYNQNSKETIQLNNIILKFIQRNTFPGIAKTIINNNRDSFKNQIKYITRKIFKNIRQCIITSWHWNKEKTKKNQDLIDEFSIHQNIMLDKNEASVNKERSVYLRNS